MLLGIKYNILSRKEKIIISLLNISLYLIALYKVYLLIKGRYNLSELNSNIYYISFAWFINTLVIVNYILYYELRKTKYKIVLYLWIIISITLSILYIFKSYYSYYYNITFLIFIVIMILAYLDKKQKNITIKISISFILMLIALTFNIFQKIKDDFEFKKISNIEKIEIRKIGKTFTLRNKNKIKDIIKDLKNSKLFRPTIKTSPNSKIKVTMFTKDKKYELTFVYGVCLNENNVNKESLCEIYINNGFIIKYKRNFYYNLKMNNFLLELVRNKINYRNSIKIYNNNEYQDISPFIQETSLLLTICLFFLFMIILLIMVNESILVRTGKKTVFEVIKTLGNLFYSSSNRR